MIKVPANVLAYCLNEDVRGAVDLLLSKRRPSVPDDLKWGELEKFFRAIGAAQQVRVDMATFLDQIWRAVWTDLPNPWESKPTDTQRLDLLSIWDDGVLRRTYTHKTSKSLTCELLIFANHSEGVQVGIDLKKGKANAFGKKEKPPGWEIYDGCIWSPEKAVPITKTIDPEDLKPFARQARDLALKRIKEIKPAE